MSTRSTSTPGENTFRYGVSSLIALIAFGCSPKAVQSTPDLHAGAPQAQVKAKGSPSMEQITNARLKFICSNLEKSYPRLTWRNNRLEFAFGSPEMSYEAIAVPSVALGGSPEVFIRPIPHLTRPIVPGFGGGLFFFEDSIAPSKNPLHIIPGSSTSPGNESR